MDKNAGIIGVGTMGRVILKRLVDEGYTVYASDPMPAAKKYISDNGGILLDSPEDVAKKTEVIILSLPAPRHIELVVLGEKGIIDAVRQDHIVIDTSTVSPGTTRKMAKALAKKGVPYLDAPILGRPVSIGNWVLPVGGDSGALEKVKPILLLFAKNIVLVGASGAGNTLKLLNQLMFSTINGITAEVFALAEKAGLPSRIFYDTVANSGAATVSGLFVECGKKVVADDYDPIFSMDLLCKDAGLGIQMAKEFGSTPVIASCVQVFNEIAQGNGYGDLDTSALVKVFENIYKLKRERKQSK